MSRAGNPEQPIVPTGVILNESEAERLEREGKAKVSFRLAPGFQRSVLLRMEKEVLLAGGRGGGKSTVARAWLLSGNPHLPDYDHNGQPTLVNMSYVYHPNYHATIIRRNRLDLEDFINKFAAMCSPYGGEWRNGAFRFPSGAWIDAGHLEDKDAWMKYVGVENIRFVIEEAVLIPDLSLYEQILGSCRNLSNCPELRPQVLLTSNALGPGAGWLIDRFMEAKDKDGNIIPPGNTIEEIVENPFTQERVTTTRVWMFSTLADNPYVINDPSYVAQLATLTDDKMRRAYLLGDWKAMSGTYFDIFRPRGPGNGEPPNASHVLHEPYPKIEPWWHLSLATDWGFSHDAATYWLRHNPNTGQMIINRELVVSQTSPEQLGYEIALRTKADLMGLPGRSTVLHLSPDAFQNRSGGERSIAELMAKGMARVLGADAIHLPDLELVRLHDSIFDPSQAEEAARRFMEESRKIRRAGITIRVANDSRVIGWQFMREAMRFTPIGEESNQFDPAFAQWLYQEKGTEKYLEYWELFRDRRRETLPRLQIFDCCSTLIASIPKAVHDEKKVEDVNKNHFKGMDSCDALRYLLIGFRDEAPQEPFEAYRDRKMEEVARQNPNYTASDLRWVQDWTQKEWKERRGGAPIPFIRRSRLLRASTTGVGETRLLPPVVLS